jgi:hypothetical protein
MKRTTEIRKKNKNTSTIVPLFGYLQQKFYEKKEE